jgi:VWFA-related protein
MRHLLAALTAVLLASAPAEGRASEYRIDLDGNVRSVVNPEGKRGRFITVQFKVRRADGGDVIKKLAGGDRFVIYEDGRLAKDLEIEAPESGPLTTILAMDISGSMATDDRIEQARRAGQVFLDRLHEGADCGLILFDHEMRVKVPPAGDEKRLNEHRALLRRHIDEARPMGGTAWRDAAAEAIQMLQGVRGRKAVIVMTDGVDLNSKHTLNELIDMAHIAEVPVYTLGVGEPGRNEPVTTVLTLDHSGSMKAPAADRDKLNKIAALKIAANRFVDLIRPGARTTLLPFSDHPGKADPFTDNKEQLKQAVNALRARGETALFDATYDALMTLRADTLETTQADRPVGKRAIVAMTDGIDNKSRRRVEQVIKLAKETQTPLHMLGLGRPKEIDERVMKRMAAETGGKYYHAENQQKLIDIFENLSIQLHDDGIDEGSLKELAEKTGGKYYLARDVSQLTLLYERVAEELQTTFRITFPSWRPQNDGTASRVEISVERGDVRISNVATDTIVRHGVVAAQMDPGVYLALLVLIGGLLVLPGGVRRLYKTVGG